VDGAQRSPVRQDSETLGGWTMQVSPRFKDGRCAPQQRILMAPECAVAMGTRLIMDALSQTLGRDVTLLFPARGGLAMLKYAQKEWPEHIENMHAIILSTMDGMESKDKYVLAWEEKRIDFSKSICVMDEMFDTGNSSDIILRHCLEKNPFAKVHFRMLFGGLGRHHRVGDALYVPYGTRSDLSKNIVCHALTFRDRVIQRWQDRNGVGANVTPMPYGAIGSVNVRFLYDGWVAFPCEQENLLHPLCADIPEDLAGISCDVLICTNDNGSLLNMGVVCSDQMDDSCGYLLMIGGFEEGRFLEKKCDPQRCLLYASGSYPLLKEEQVRFIAKKRGYKEYRIVSMRCVDRSCPQDLLQLKTSMTLHTSTMCEVHFDSGVFDSARDLINLVGER